MMRAAAVAGLVLILACPAAQACGHCVEDKVAAVYDHAVVTRAQAEGRAVAFFAIDGDIAPNEPLRRAVDNAARSAYGVDGSSVRVSLELASLSLSFDPRRTSYDKVRRSIEKNLTDGKLKLEELRFMDAMPAKASGRH